MLHTYLYDYPSVADLGDLVIDDLRYYNTELRTRAPQLFKTDSNACDLDLVTLQRQRGTNDAHPALTLPTSQPDIVKKIKSLSQLQNDWKVHLG